MNVLVGILKQLNFDREFLALKIDFIGLFALQFSDKLGTRLRAPLLDLSV